MYWEKHYLKLRGKGSRPILLLSNVWGLREFETILCYAPYMLLTAKTHKETYPNAI